MSGKWCLDCKVVKPITEFYIHKSNGRTNKLFSCCILCQKAKNKLKYKKYSLKHKAKIKKYKKSYHKLNQARLCNKSKIWRITNLNHYKQRKHKYYTLHKNEILAKNGEYRKHRLKTDSLYKLKHNIRSLIKISISGKGFSKTSKTYQILGCSFNEFKVYIENKFKPGMTWLNHKLDGWHLDHIIPMCAAKTKEDAIRLNHYTNFQPLWAEENLKKIVEDRKYI